MKPRGRLPKALGQGRVSSIHKLHCLLVEACVLMVTGWNAAPCNPTPSTRTDRPIGWEPGPIRLAFLRRFLLLKHLPGTSCTSRRAIDVPSLLCNQFHLAQGPCIGGPTMALVLHLGIDCGQFNGRTEHEPVFPRRRRKTKVLPHIGPGHSLKRVVQHRRFVRIKPESKEAIHGIENGVSRQRQSVFHANRTSGLHCQSRPHRTRGRRN